MKVRQLLVVGLAVFGLGIAQEPQMAPAPELKKLEWFLGEWNGKVKWSMPGMDATEETMSFKNEWEGQFIKSSSVMSMSGTKMTEVGYIGWNPKTKKYDNYTFTNFAPTPRIEHGELDGDKMTFTSDPWDVMETPVVGRATVTRKSPTELAFLLEFKMGDAWQKVAEGAFKKKA
jgi:hypothetical protein